MIIIIRLNFKKQCSKLLNYFHKNPYPFTCVCVVKHLIVSSLVMNRNNIHPATAGTSYPPRTLSGPTGTAAVSSRRGFFTSWASASKASLSSVNRRKNHEVSKTQTNNVESMQPGVHLCNAAQLTKQF
jgi:hypothetical protein